MKPDTLLALEQLNKQGIYYALAAVVEALAETRFVKSFDKRRKSAQAPSRFRALVAKNNAGRPGLNRLDTKYEILNTNYFAKQTQSCPPSADSKPLFDKGLRTKNHEP